MPDQTPVDAAAVIEALREQLAASNYELAIATARYRQAEARLAHKE